MKPYVVKLGRMVEKRVPTDPAAARRLLTAAYSWVGFSGRHNRLPGVAGEYARMNGAAARIMADTFRHGGQSVMVNLFMPCELLHAMDLLPMFPEGLSAYISNTACDAVFVESAEARDVPESFCSYHKTMIGAAETGVLSKPLLIANTTLACDANQVSFRRLADYYQVPHIVIDVPSRKDEEAVAYVAEQLRNAGAVIAQASGRTLNEEKLRSCVARSGRTLDAYQAYLRQRAAVTLPTTMTGELCALMSNHIMLGTEAAESFMQGILRSAQKAPPAGEKKRILWLHTMPNWQDSMRAIFDGGPRCEIVGCDVAYDTVMPMDPDHPYESMARRAVYNIANGPAQSRVDAAVHYAKLLRADGAVVFCHWGCKQTMGMSQLAKKALEAEGFPTLVLDGDGCDSRNASDGQMVTRVNAFLEQLEGRVR